MWGELCRIATQSPPHFIRLFRKKWNRAREVLSSIDFASYPLYSLHHSNDLFV